MQEASTHSTFGLLKSAFVDKIAIGLSYTMLRQIPQRYDNWQTLSFTLTMLLLIKSSLKQRVIL